MIPSFAHVTWMPMITLHHWALPHPFSLHLVKKRRWPGLIEPCRCIGSHRRNVQAHNNQSIPWWHGKTWLFQTHSCTPICKTHWQPLAMPSGHHETICQWVWLSAWWMEGGWMRMQRTLASIHIHPPLECIRQMIHHQNHLNLMHFGSSMGHRGVLASGNIRAVPKKPSFTASPRNWWNITGSYILLVRSDMPTGLC